MTPPSGLPTISGPADEMLVRFHVLCLYVTNLARVVCISLTLSQCETCAAVCKTVSDLHVAVCVDVAHAVALYVA